MQKSFLMGLEKIEIPSNCLRMPAVVGPNFEFLRAIRFLKLVATL